MKKVLITGDNSFIGDRFAQWLQQWPEDYQVTKIDMKDASWPEQDWSIYDTILHVAGIAHVSSDPKLEDLYYQVNRDLTIEAAQKAKKEGVQQFIFMSSIIIFGSQAERISKDTPANPDNFYGDSKLQAERGIQPLADEHFKVAIVRPPMVYGPGSKGNFPLLVKLAKVTPIFPDYPNQRSMIFIDNLCEILRQVVDNEVSGIIHPQNAEYVKTSEMVRLIGEVSGHKIHLTKVFNPVIRLLIRQRLINKVFGDLYYINELDIADDDINLETSIRYSLGSEDFE